MPNKERVPTEEYQVGERIRCLVKAVQEGPHGPEIILSRADTKFIVKLFQLEVSEINDGTIEIKGIAREFKVGEIVEGNIVKIIEVGAIMDLGGGKDGMIHVSELKQGFVKNVEDVVKMGDFVRAKIIRVGDDGRIGLSMKQLQ